MFSSWDTEYIYPLCDEGQQENMHAQQLATGSYVYPEIRFYRDGTLNEGEKNKKILKTTEMHSWLPTDRNVQKKSNAKRHRKTYIWNLICYSPNS